MILSKVLMDNGTPRFSLFLGGDERRIRVSKQILSFTIFYGDSFYLIPLEQVFGHKKGDAVISSLAAFMM